MSYSQKHSLILEGITKRLFHEKIISTLIFLILISCSTSAPMSSDFDNKKIEQISDSIQIENVTVKNVFKYQVLAHQSFRY